MARPPAATNGTSRAALLLTLAGVVAILYFTREVLIPIALAILLSFALSPLVRWLERFMGRIAAAVLVTVAMLLVVGSLAYVMTTQVTKLALKLPDYQGNIRAKLEKLSPHGGTIDRIQHNIEELSNKKTKPTTQTTQPVDVTATKTPAEPDRPPAVNKDDRAKIPNPAAQPTRENPLPVAVIAPPVSPLQALFDYGGLILGPLGTAGVVVVFVLFMLLNREDLRDRMIRLIGFGQLTVTTKAVDDAASRISRYLAAQAMVNGSYGLLVGLGLWIIGMAFGQGQGFPNDVHWGILCAVLRFIPYVGPWIGASFPLAVGFAVFPGFTILFAVVALIVTIELVSSNVMEPWLYGSSTGMNSMAVLVAAVFWAWLWGPVGLILSTPLTVCLAVLGQYVSQLHFLSVLLGDKPVLDLPSRIYQRLVAGDQEEAMDLVDDAVDEKPLIEVLDDLLLPVLTMAESDRHKGLLDDDRNAFVHASLRDIIELLEEKAPAARSANAAAEGSQAVSANPVRIVCLPAHDDADEIAAMMLRLLLEREGYLIKVIPVAALAGEMMDRVEADQSDIVCISAVPPAAVTYTRYLCKRLKSRTGNARLLIGLWSSRVDIDKAKSRIQCDTENKIALNMRSAFDQLRQMAARIALARNEPRTEAAV